MLLKGKIKDVSQSEFVYWFIFSSVHFKGLAALAEESQGMYFFSN